MGADNQKVSKLQGEHGGLGSALFCKGTAWLLFEVLNRFC